tara:strand:- start:1072 stop:1386 length:315 start_codon:yes stop_codon:yes gene_type:complete
MKKVLLLTLIIFGSNVWADEHEVSGSESIKACEVKVTKKSFEGIENCNKGDILRVNGRKASAWRHLDFQAMACLPETIYRPEQGGVVVDYICEYRGRVLDLVKL